MRKTGLQAQELYTVSKLLADLELGGLQEARAGGGRVLEDAETGSHSPAIRGIQQCCQSHGLRCAPS